MELANGVELAVQDGKAILSVEFGAIVNPALDAVKADIESGKIDLVKGTDMDKEFLMKAIDFIKMQLASKLV